MDDIIVIKLGGISCEALDQAFFMEIQKLQQRGKKIIIVHGGGASITKWMDRLNIQVEIKEGLRVTNQAALEVTKMVLIGEVQPHLLQQFQQQNLKCLGLNAADNQLLSGEKIKEGQLGYVGEIQAVNTALLSGLLQQGHILIVAPLALDKTGHWLNINADETASKIAKAMAAEELVLMTEVDGVKYQEKVIKMITSKETNQFIENGTVTGGMIPKLKCAHYALENGVKQVRITLNLATSGTKIV